MYKFVIFCIFGLFVVKLHALEDEIVSDSHAANEDSRRNEIEDTKKFIKMMIRQYHLTCDNYLSSYCKDHTSHRGKSTNFYFFCQIPLKGYLCNHIKDGEAFDQLFDKFKAALLAGKSDRTSSDPSIEPDKTF